MTNLADNWKKHPDFAHERACQCYVRSDGWRVHRVGPSWRSWYPRVPERPYAPRALPALHREAVEASNLREQMGGPFGSAEAAMKRVDKVAPLPARESS